MPAISKIRFTNVIYENGGKRYNDEIFHFDGHNGAIVLENGGGKTVFIQTAIQAVVPHMELAERKVKETLHLENGAAHVAIEWILNDRPRRYAITAVTLYIENNGVNSYKYAYEYGGEDPNNIENIPFIRENEDKTLRPAGRGEILDYYQRMAKQYMGAKLFDTITDYHTYIEEHYKIIPSEWRKIGIVNSAEGDVDRYFEGCKTTSQLLNKLLIPVVEEAIEGEYKQDFVKTFEKQREHFKKNKILLEQINESRETSQQLEKYIEVYEKLHQRETEYCNQKQIAKSAFKYIENALDDYKQRLIIVDEKLRTIDEKNRSYEMKKLSLRILERKLEIEQLSEEHKKYAKDYDEIKTQYDLCASRKQNIEISEIKNEIETLTAQIDLASKQLSHIEQDEQIQDLLDRLADNSSQLKGYFSDRLERYEKEKQEILNQKNQYETQKVDLENTLVQAGNKLREVHGHRVKLETLHQRLTNECKNIAMAILDQQEGASVEDKRAQWEERIAVLKNLAIQTEESIRLEDEEKEGLQRELSGHRKKLLSMQSHVSQLESENERFEAEQEQIRVLLDPYVRVHSNAGLYEKQSTFEAILIEKEVQQQKRKEAAMKEERMKCRLADQYGEASVFTADGMLIQLVEELQSTTSYIELGSKYYNEMKKSSDSGADFDGYPYWPITLITSQKDLQTVQERIEKIADEISHPVIVLTADRVSHILQNPKDFDEGLDLCVYPVVWKYNMDPGAFETWKKELLEDAQEKRNARIEEETAYQNIVALRKRVHEFFSTYSKDSFDILLDEIERSKMMCQQIQEDISNSEGRILKIEKNYRLYHQKLFEYKDELTKLNQKIHDANQYIAKQKELKANEDVYVKVLKVHEQVTMEISSLEMDIKRQGDILEEINDKLLGIKKEIDRITDNPLYKEVKNEDPIYSELSYEVLTERRKTIMDMISGKNADRDVLETRIKEKQAELSKKQETLRLREQEAVYPVEIITQYYSKELSDLIEQIKKRANQLNEYKERLNQCDMKLLVLNNSKNEWIKDCLEKYGSVMEWDEDVLQIQNQLEDERKQLKKERDVLFKERDKFTANEKRFSDYVHRLNLINYKHDFMGIDLQGTLDSRSYLPDDIENYTLETLDSIEKELDKASKLYENQKAEAEAEKNRFKRYCHMYIKDTKLKDMVISGIDHKTDYESLREFGTKMLERINHIIKLAEHDRMTGDKELQIFLDHLNTYVNTVIHELDAIQRKTRINIDGNMKQIFIFDIPKWEEATAKEELRKHIDWIIDQLENTNQEEQDELTTQKNLENWLSVKRLLQCILGDQTIKIKCRKVTNDMKISSLPSSWEHSNQWSGGEKWSKNMTLFLGLLIYIAEKKQYLSHTDKKHRAVILDNPFGKASSKHVLDPVFYIAERLGFQIIALTAHAEGEFIRNYFPVVYSCKLKASTDPSKQIMTKEKEIHYAYLLEHDPQSLQRFQEVDQMTIDTLFSL